VKTSFPCLYVIDSNSSRNHCVSKKCRTVQSFKLHFFQNSHLMLLYTSVSNCRGVATFLEAILWKHCNSADAVLMMSVASRKRCPFSADCVQGSRWKSAGAKSGE
jgi:hypothetical protein